MLDLNFLKKILKKKTWMIQKMNGRIQSPCAKHPLKRNTLKKRQKTQMQVKNIQTTVWLTDLTKSTMLMEESITR